MSRQIPVTDELRRRRRRVAAVLADRIAHVAEELRCHPRHALLAALVIGLLAAPLEPRLVLLIAAAVVAVVANSRLVVGLVAGVAVLSGALGAQARLASLDRTGLRPLLGTTVTVRATLLEQPRPVRYGSTALVQLEGFEPPSASGTQARAGDNAAAGRPGGPARHVEDGGAGERVLLRIGSRVGWPALATGATIRVSGRLRALGPFEQYARRRGAHAALKVDAALATGAVRGGAWRVVDGVRMRAESALARGLPVPQAALLRGMVLGEDSALNERTRTEFRTSGLSHLMAASGQNVALLAALALPLLAWLGAGLRLRLVGLLVLVALYVPLAGGGPSIQRAGVMGAATIVAALAGRPASRWYALLLAAAATLALNPRVSGDPGWQLSFAAVATIALLAPALRAWLHERRIPEQVADAIAVSLAATLGTAPLIAFHFAQLSLVSLPANLLAAPAIAPIMWLGMLAAGLGQLAAVLAYPFNQLNAFLLGYVGSVAHASARLPHASMDVALGGPFVLAAVYVAIVLLVMLARACARHIPAYAQRAFAQVRIVNRAAS